MSIVSIFATNFSHPAGHEEGLSAAAAPATSVAASSAHSADSSPKVCNFDGRDVALVHQQQVVQFQVPVHNTPARQQAGCRHSVMTPALVAVCEAATEARETINPSPGVKVLHAFNQLPEDCACVSLNVLSPGVDCIQQLAACNRHG
jgi:hypothetical protein